MGNVMNTTILPVVLQDHHYVRLFPDNADVEYFLLVEGDMQNLQGRKDEIKVLAEWPKMYFLTMLKSLDLLPVPPSTLLDVSTVGRFIADACSMLTKTFGMVTTEDQARSIIEYWSETYYIFHPGASNEL